MIKRAIITGETKDLQAFINEWYEDEKDKEVPQIEEGMDIFLPVKEEHERQIKSLAIAFHLHCTIF